MYKKFVFLLCGMFLMGLVACQKDSNSEESLDVRPTLVTSEATEITHTSAIVSGSIEIAEHSDVGECGFMYSTESSMAGAERVTVAFNGSSTYQATLGGLLPDTRYYYCIYANVGDIETQGNILDFTTLAGETPSLGTTVLVEATETSLTVASSVENNGGYEIQQYGFAYKPAGSSEEEQMAVADNMANDSQFTLTIEGLAAGTDYEVRSFAVYDAGTVYGETVTLATTAHPVEPELGKVTVNEIGEKTALLAAQLVNEGGYEIIRFGFVYRIGSEGQEVQVEVTDKNAEGVFQCQLENLQPGIEYQARAFVETESGILYTEAVSFTTLANQTLSVEIELGTVTDVTIDVSGKVLGKDSSENPRVTEVGFCYSDTETLPTVDNKIVSTLEGTSFQEVITDLKPNTIYYIRAYAISEAEVTYSKIITVTTLPDNTSDRPDINDNVSPDK